MLETNVSKASIGSRQVERVHLWPFVVFLVLTSGLTLGGFWINRIAFRNLPLMTWLPYAGYVAGTGPSIAGLLLIAFFNRRTGLVWLVQRFHPGLIGWGWFLVAICLVTPFEWLAPAAILVAIVLGASADLRSLFTQCLATRALGWRSLLPALCLLVPIAIEYWTWLLISVGWGQTAVWNSFSFRKYAVASILGGIMGAGLFEELGWRGFALPQLQRCYSAFTSSLIIGLAWALWHLGNFIVRDPFPWLEFSIYVPTVVSMSVLFTWIFNATRGSLLCVMALHGAINASVGLIAWDRLIESDQDSTLTVMTARCILYSLTALVAVALYRTGVRVTVPQTSRS